MKKVLEDDVPVPRVVGESVKYCIMFFGIFAFLCGWIAFANSYQGRLVVDMIVPTQDVSQVFYSRSGEWSEAQSVSVAVHEGSNRITFALPLRLGAHVRFDPGGKPDAYKILNAYWQFGAIRRDIAFSSILSLSSLDKEKTEQAGLIVSSHDNDPQLLLNVPSAVWRSLAVLAFVAPMVLSILLLLFLILKRRIGPVGMASWLFCTAFGYFIFSVFKFGVWLPDFDDWRYVGVGLPRFSFLNNDLGWLYAVGNDSTAFVGTVMDFVALRTSNFNFGLLRIMALGLLGLYCLLKIKVIAAVTKNNPFVCAAAIAAMTLSLATDTYWGTTAIAYQQFLPVFFGAGVIYALVNAGEDGLSPARFVSISLLSVFACLSYISGPILIGALSLALVCTELGQLRSRVISSRFKVAVMLGCISFVLMVMSVYLLTMNQGSLISHNHAVASIYPTDLRFWIFFNAQFGRAIGYIGSSAIIDALITALLLAPFFTMLVTNLSQFFGAKELPPSEPAHLLIFFAGICSLLYAATVSFGRAGFIPLGADEAVGVAIAKSRFHYWWIATLMPYFLLSWIIVVRSRLVEARSVARLAYAAIIVAFLLPKSISGWDYASAYGGEKDRVASGAYCVTQGIKIRNADADFVCPDIIGLDFNLKSVAHNIRAKKLQVYYELSESDFARSEGDHGR